MNNLFTPTVRDQAIETTCSNLIMAGLLLPKEVAGFMCQVTSYADLELAEILCHSRLLLDNYLEHCWNLN